MLTPLTERQQSLIVANVVKACKDITKLNKTGYKFLYLASGFIAHYNLHGFICHYGDGSLANAIIRNGRYNQWLNFRLGDQDYDYYKSKAETYNKILAKLA